MMNIFIVEDEVSLGKMMAQFLSQLGHRVIFVSSAEKAIEILRKMDGYEGVFLVDRNLGDGMSGIDFVGWLRDNAIYNQVVILTGYADEKSVQVCTKELGVSCFISKPITLELLREELVRAVEQRGAHKGIYIEQARDQTVRYLFADRRIEFARLSIPNRRVSDIICISSQDDCGMGCQFCETGMSRRGHVRNLEVEELLMQVSESQDCCQKHDREVCISIMGRGEPSYNINNIAEFMDRLGGNYSFAISTVGVIPRLGEFVERFRSNNRIELQFSLHFPDDKLRAQHMPVARKNPLARVFPLLEDFSDKSPLPVCLNYSLFNGLNEGERYIEALIKLVEGKRFEVKLTGASPFGIYQPVDIERVEAIEAIFDSVGVPHRRFFSKGQEVGAGCGQMAARIGTRG